MESPCHDKVWLVEGYCMRKIVTRNTSEKEVCIYISVHGNSYPVGHYPDNHDGTRSNFRRS